MLERIAGVLLHPTSLPGPHGIGDLGAGARRWIDWLAGAGQRLWQLLPLAPVGFSGSPYDGPSGVAGEPLLISLEDLHEDGLLDRAALLATPPFASGRVAWERAGSWKGERLRRAWSAFAGLPPDAPLVRGHAAWTRAPEQRTWLGDWALYAALRARRGEPWTAWPAELRDRDPGALADARAELAGEVGFHRFVQFLLWRQWERLRRHAAECGVRILGDLPIYTALDSAEVWARRELFDLDTEGRPRHLSGVPPDAYSDRGQLWGHPLYRWDRLRAEGFSWWIERLSLACHRYDLVRIDHFRGFAGYWEVPAGSDQAPAETAAGGRWRPGPGRELFDAARAALGALPLVAEDLGEITDDVHALRQGLGLPGMRVLQFGFGEDGEEHLPRNWGADVAGYTATHDNDTCRGWFDALDGETRERVLAELGGEGSEIHWTMIRAVLRSPAAIAIAPLQDLLGLGSEGRLNRPGRAEGNWGWRLEWRQLTPELGARLCRLTERSGRLAGAGASGGGPAAAARSA